MRYRSPAALVVLLALAPATSLAEDAPVVARVAEHDRRGADLFARGEYEAAIQELEAAERLLPASERSLNLAVCHDRLGRAEQAIALYQQVLDSEQADEALRGYAADRIAVLRAARRGSATERPAGTAPELFEPEPVAREGRPGVRPRRVTPAAVYAMVGVTAAAGVAMAVLAGLAYSEQRELDDLTAAADPESTSAEQWEVERQQAVAIRSRGLELATAADVMIGVTSAAALVTVVLAAVAEWHPPAGRARAEMGLAASPGRLAVAGRF